MSALILLVFVVGVAAIVAGAFLIHPGAAVAVSGFGLLRLAALLDRRGS